MAKGRELKGRIKTVENTRKITRTMEMVATSKMKRAQDRVVAARPFANSLSEVIANLYTPELAEAFPLLRQPATVNKAAIIVLTSNRGLAGAFNANLLNAAEIVDALIDRFASGEIDAVYIVYAKFQSALSTPPASQMILPVTPPERTGPQPDYILLPSAEVILTQLLPSYVRNSVYRALVETAAGEQGARRTAMKNATDNAGEMLNVLRRTFNRARQAQITQEIAEIVGGAAALQG
jgi:F-type H+-transporting ATPase subunit gamma